MTHTDRILEFIEWLRLNRPERPDYQEQVRVSARDAETLENALRKRPALGVFGQSQAGKSYLVNALLRDKENTFLIKGHPDGAQLNFIECNPNKNAEATALITRFTTGVEADWDRAYFKIDLLSFEEMIGSLFHGYALQVNDETRRDLYERSTFSIESFEAEGEGQAPYLNKHALRQLENLFHDKSIRRHSYLKSRATEVSRFLNGKSRLGSSVASKLISSVLWPGYSHMIELSGRLVEVYAELSDAKTLYAPFKLQNIKAVLDTEHLLGYATEPYKCTITKHDGYQVYLEIGSTGTRDLRDIQALAKEVTFFVQKENLIAACLEELDLLDLPGLRPNHDAETQEGKDSLSHDHLPWLFMKMGKLRMFINSSTKYDEIPLLLYCTEDAPQNAPQVTLRLKEWLEQNNRDQERLLTVMTKSDILWHGHVTPDVLKDRLKTRFETHFKKHLGDLLDYERYERAYLVRNPLVSSGLEKPDPALVNQFLSSHYVQKYLESRKEATWNALMDQNDGGFSVLAEDVNRLFVGIAQEREHNLKSKLRAILEQQRALIGSLMIKEDELEHSREVTEAAKKLIADIRDVGELKVMPSILKWVDESFPGVEYVFQPNNGSKKRANTATERVHELVDQLLMHADREMTERQTDLALSGKGLPNDSADWYKRALIAYVKEKAGLTEYVGRYINVFGQLEDDERQALWEAIRSLYSVTATYLGTAPGHTTPDPSVSLDGFFAEKNLFHHWEAHVDSFFEAIKPEVDVRGQDALKEHYETIRKAISELV